MSTKSKKLTTQVPGETPTADGAADGPDENLGGEPDAPAPAPKAKRAKPVAATDMNEPAPADALPPKIKAVMEDATKMAHDEAVKAAAEGKIVDRVLTEKGWYIPNANREI